ncbi:MAG: DUF2922 domain-containing protein [Defluviitaleaceae bacterium]|nr:DUF2922 domain-containing protein [Defluviitaleaceae bacterium]
METRHDFRLHFLSNQNETMTLNIPRANAAATGPQVSAAMLAIINSGVVQSTRGEPFSKKAADLVATNRRDFNVL